MKEIHFYKDLKEISLYDFLNKLYPSHNETIKAIKYDIEVIHTTALSALCFSNLLDKGYKIFLHENGKCGEVYEGTTELTDKELRKGHNISNIWIGGGFNNYFMTKFKHPFNDERCARRLLWEYQNYDRLIVGVDFDNTIRPIKPDSSCEEVIELLRRCSKDPKITLCLWSISVSQEEEQEKLDFCESLGITIDHVNYSPFEISRYIPRKQFFNVLLDDRAGLESAYNNLKYVLDNINN